MKRRRPAAGQRAVDHDEPVRAVIYVRLSKATDSRENTEVGLGTQEAGCRRAVEALGGRVVAVEQDIQSGDRLDRPGVWRAIDRVKSGAADTLVVYAVDRLGRDDVQQGVILLELRRAGGRLLSATENIEGGPMGDLMRNLHTFAAAAELLKARERVNRAIDAKFRQTERYKPGQRAPYGYRKVGTKADTRYEVDEAEAAIVRRIFTERAAGASIRTILLGLNRDRVPSPVGRGSWSTSTVAGIVDRTVYGTGEHEVWRTRTERDADNIPYLVDRPADERYRVAFPPFLEPSLLSRARATAERNVWSKARADRPAEVGILRYGFGRCGSCGRALTVMSRTNLPGKARYACSGGMATTGHTCPSRTSITIEQIDAPVWWWIQGVMEDPSRAEAWRVVRKPSEVDAAMVEALKLAEAKIAELEPQVAGLIDNLALLTGEGARVAAERLNALSDELAQVRTVRDRTAEAQALVAQWSQPERVLEATDAVSEAVLAAIAAMHEADPNPVQSHTVTITSAGGAWNHVTLPDSWKARRAAMAVLGVTVTVHTRESGQPRWVAEMQLSGGTVVTGAVAPDGYRVNRGYMFASHR